MRKILFGLFLFTMVSITHGEEQPPYEVQEPGISENFRNIYYAADKLSLLTTLFSYTFTSSSNTLCIDSPTFCVNALTHRISISTSSATPGNTVVVNNTDFIVDSTNHIIGIGVQPSANVILDMQGAGGGSLVTRLKNMTTGSGANAFNILQTASTNSGYPYTRYTDGTNYWSVGKDQQSSHNFIIAKNSDPSTNQYLIINSTTTGVAISGTNTNNNAATGFVGEYIESMTGNVNCPTTGQYGDNISITLTAGDWDISVITYFNSSTACIWTRAAAGIGTVTGNDSTGIVTTGTFADGPLPLDGVRGGSCIIPPWRASITATTTYYLKVFALYTVGTAQYAGKISARRIR